MPDFQRTTPTESTRTGWILGLLVLAFAIFIIVGVTKANSKNDCDEATWNYQESERQDIINGWHPSDFELESRRRALEEACE
jgi:hypothetical protein